MDGRKRLSGAEYRKKADEKKRKIADVLNKTVKLDAFFKPNIQAGESSTSSNIAERVVDLVDSNQDDICQSNDQKEVSQSVDSSYVETVSVKLSNDPVHWEVNEWTKEYFLKHGFEQNKDCNFENSKRVYPEKNRFLSKSLFERQLANGDIVSRNYLVYSPSQGSVFCGPCKLFCKSSTSQFVDGGFSDWKHGSQCVKEHENSTAHLDSLLTFKQRAAEIGTINKLLISQVEEEVNYWRAVLHRVVCVIKQLASRGLAFRGDEEVFGSPNNGNFMMCLELIAEFDPFLKAHINKYGNPGQGKSLYLSSTVCEELIELMGKSVLDTILNELKKSKYFSIVVDSTPDSTHSDQLSFILRYVNENGLPEERFVGFLKNRGHIGAQLAEAVLDFLNKCGLDIQNCRGQSFDNASNMSGIYSGLQARLKEVNPLMFYVPCSAHSLNLVGSSAAECCLLSRHFFDLLQSLYNFFASSTHRWSVLESYFKPEDKNLSLKSLSITRWSAREEACKSLNRDFEPIIKALKSIFDSSEENAVTKSKAKGLLNQLLTKETTFMAAFWGNVMHKFNAVSEKVQSLKMNVNTVVTLYSSLIEFASELRETFDFFKIEGEKKLRSVHDDNDDFQTESFADRSSRLRKRKKFFDESDSSDSEQENETREENVYSKLKETYELMIDKLLFELNKRISVYKEFLNRFSFLSNLSHLSATDITSAATSFQALYSTDIETSSFVIECLHLKGHLVTKEKTTTEEMSLSQLYRYIVANDLQILYPNISVAIKIFLCTPASNCSAERSFSTLARVKNFLRSTVGQKRLVNLAVLAIEEDLTSKLDFNDVIDAFARNKARRKKM